MPDEARRLLPASGHLGQRGEGHAPPGSAPRIPGRPIMMPPGARKNAGDALEATARGHRVVDHRVRRELQKRAVGSVLDEVVDAFPLTAYGVQHFHFLNRKVASMRIHFVRGFAVEPVIGAAQTEALGRDDAHVIGRVALAQAQE